MWVKCSCQREKRNHTKNIRAAPATTQQQKNGDTASRRFPHTPHTPTLTSTHANTHKSWLCCCCCCSCERAASENASREKKALEVKCSNALRMRWVDSLWSQQTDASTKVNENEHKKPSKPRRWARFVVVVFGAAVFGANTKGKKRLFLGRVSVCQSLVVGNKKQKTKNNFAGRRRGGGCCADCWVKISFNPRESA